MERKISIPSYARAVIDTAQRGGAEIYIVGGCVRDVLLGKEPNDYDMAISCAPEHTLKIFTEAGFRTVETGLKHGTLTVLSDSRPIEITSFRVDGEYSDSRHPSEVTFTPNLKDDLARRDFTVNAMAYNDEKGLVDLFGGADDLDRKIIRAVGEAQKRFEEDALRIMRAFRFSAKLGFKIEEKTLFAAERCKEKLRNISRERICNELLQLLCTKEPKKAILLMQKSGILEIITDGVLNESRALERAAEGLAQLPPQGSARLGLLLSTVDEAEARRFLNSLKCSNKILNDSLTVRRGALMSVENERDAAEFVKKIGRDNAVNAVKASVLCGNSSALAKSLVESSKAPASVGELEVGGSDILALGVIPKEIGKILGILLEEVIIGELPNEKEALTERAKALFENF